MLVTQLSGTDSYAIKSQQVEDHESIETLNRTSSSEDSVQEEEEDGVEDSSEEKAKEVEKRSAQFSRNSDEFDNFSIENDNRRRPVVGPAQPTNVRNPVFRNSDERIDASDELRSVLASRVRPNVPTQTAFANSDRLPLVPMSFRNLARQQQQPDDDFDDDISIEIRNRVAVTQPVIQQRVVATSTATVGRLPSAVTGLRNPILIRQQSDDDFDDVSLEIVRQVAPTPVRQVVPTTQTALPNRLPVPMGFRTQLVRESDGDLSLEVVRVTPNQPTVPSPNNNQAANSNIRTAVFRQSDERDDVSVEIFGSLLNRNAGQLQTAPPAAQQTSAIRPIQQANNRQQPIQTFNQVNIVSARPVTARPQVQPPVTARPQVQPSVTTATQPAVASSSNRLPLVPMGFRNTILVRQSDDFDDDISLEIIRDRVAPATSVVQQVVATQPATSDRLPVPMSFRNPILRQSDEFDDVSIEIRDRNVFTAPQQVNQPAANGQAGTPVNANRPEFVVTQDADGDVSLELVSRVQSQQPAAGVENQSVQQQGFSISPVRPLVPPRPVLAAGSLVQTGNEGQRVNVFDDYSLEDNDDDNDDFFLEDQFDNVDGFRLLASDFFAQSTGNGFPVERSVENQSETDQKDMQDRAEEDNLAEPVSLDDSDFHVPSAESDDWFLVKQYMDHDYSSEELEGELAKEYFWQPVKDASKKVKTDQDKMAELKPARS